MSDKKRKNSVLNEAQLKRFEDIKKRADARKNDPNLRHELTDEQARLQNELYNDMETEIMKVIFESDYTEEAFDMNYEKMSTEELQKLVGLDKVGSIQASAGDEAVIREEGDVFADWYREELIRTLRETDVIDAKSLTQEQKELLRNFIGNSSSEIDMNKVRDWWKYEATDEDKSDE